MGASAESETVFRSTRITELTDELDAFGHRDYAATVAKVLAEAEPPFTLGLYGPWGVGKTVVIEATRTQLGANCASVVFDAWRYDGDALRRHFLRDVAQRLKQTGQLEDAYDPEKELKDLDVSTSEPKTGKMRVSTNQVVQGVVGLVLLSLVAAGFYFAGDLKHATVGLITVAASGLVAICVAALSPFARVIEVTQATEIRQRLVDPEKFTEKFEDLLAAVKRERLVVAIDNLDRCSPRRVTELLETLNTYLEPASTPGSERSKKLRERRAKNRNKPDAVFVVAADDLALKRHVESQEAKASEGASSSDDVRSDVGRYADEYLRKIFTAAIPIKPVLGPDLRDYVDSELETISKNRSIAAGDRNRLIEVITEGLRRNPRRVSQFIRNLELRLRLLDERHAGGRIAEVLTNSSDVPFVAKLLVLEEEWPKVFRELERDSTRLATWHEQQQTGVSLVEVDFTKEPAGAEQALLSFFATTRSIASSRLPAYLSLKQSRNEVKLPRYADFESALISGAPKLLEEVTSSATPEELAQYADELEPLFRGQLPRYLANARNVVETALADPVLRANAQPKLAELLGRALGLSEAFRIELRRANQEAVLPAADWLPDAEFNQLVKLFVSGSGDDAVVRAEPLTVLPAARLNQQNLERIAIALSDEVLGLSPDDVLRILEWCPGAASAEVGRAALARLEQATTGDQADVRIIEICLQKVWAGDPAESGSEQPRPSDAIIVAVGGHAVRAFEPSSAVEARPTIVASLVPLLRQIAENDRELGRGESGSRTNALNAFAQSYNVLQGSLQDERSVEPALDLLGTAGDLLGADSVLAPTIQGFVTQMGALLPNALVSYATDRGPNVPPALLPDLARVLATLIDGQREDAARALAAIDPADGQGQLVASITRLIQNGYYPLARRMLEELPVLEQHRGALARLPIETGATADPDLQFSVAFADVLAEPDRELLEQRLVNVIAGGASPDPSALLGEVEAAPAFKKDADRFIWRLFDMLTQHPVAPPIPLLQLLMPRFKRLDESRKTAFVQLVEGWLQQGAGSDLLSVLSSSPQFAGAQRTKLVDVLLDRQSVVPATNHAHRVELIRCAEQVAAGAAPTVGRVNDRINLLAGGTPDDLEVYRILRPGA